jgi:hypothetical protein
MRYRGAGGRLIRAFHGPKSGCTHEYSEVSHPGYAAARIIQTGGEAPAGSAAGAAPCIKDCVLVEGQADQAVAALTWDRGSLVLLKKR